MPVDLTVPDDSKVLPPVVPQPNIPPNPQVQAVANANAKAKLKQKNRKKNGIEIEFPGLMLNFEDATCYNVNGFCPNADQQKFYVEEVEFRIQGKGGSKTRLRLRPTQDW